MNEERSGFVLNDRAAGALVGLAIGDALGAPYEFKPPLQREPRMEGGGSWHWAPGEWTDDASLAVAVAEVTATGSRDPTAIGERFLDWYARWRKDKGGLTSSVLGSTTDSASLPGIAQQHAEAGGLVAGNGSLMRTAPVALAALGDDEAIAAAARAVSAITHADLDCQDACVLWCIAIDRAVRFGRLDRVRDGLAQIPGERRERWAALLSQAEDTDDPTTFNNNGWVVHALQAAYVAVRLGDRESEGWARFRTGIHAAVKSGYDTDTVGAIAGMLLGAAVGASAIPSEWKVLLHDHLGRDVRDLTRLAVLTRQGGRTDEAGWPGCPSLAAEYMTSRPPSGFAPLPGDDGILVGDFGAVEAAGADVVVSLCRMGEGDVPDAMSRLDVVLLDSPNPAENPNLDWVVTDTVAFVRARRAEGKRVFVHCVAAEKRTPLLTVALLRSLGTQSEEAFRVARDLLPRMGDLPQCYQDCLQRLGEGGLPHIPTVCPDCRMWANTVGHLCPQ